MAALRLIVFADGSRAATGPPEGPSAGLLRLPRAHIDPNRMAYEAAIDALIPEAEDRADVKTNANKVGRDNVPAAKWSREFHRAMDELARAKKLRCLTWQAGPEQD